MQSSDFGPHTFPSSSSGFAPARGNDLIDFGALVSGGGGGGQDDAVLVPSLGAPPAEPLQPASFAPPPLPASIRPSRYVYYAQRLQNEPDSDVH